MGLETKAVTKCMLLVCAAALFWISVTGSSAGADWELGVDSDCPANPGCPADIDFSGYVNSSDFLVLKDNWYKSCSAENSWCQGADFTCDGIVNYADFSILTETWGKCPEPVHTEPKEIAVQALLRYAGADSSFHSLDSLTEEQKESLLQALGQLQGRNFVVFNGEIVVLNECSPSGLGPELAANGSLESAANWVEGKGWRINNGYALWDEMSGNDSLEQSIPTNADRKYEVAFRAWDIGEDNGNGSVAAEVGGTKGTVRTSEGFYTEEIVAADSSGIKFVAGSSGFEPGMAIIDDVSVREVLPGECPNDRAEVYDEGDLVFLEVFSGGESKGRVLLQDLRGLDEKEDCSRYDSGGTEQDPFGYVICHAENHAKEHPEAKIGEEPALVDFVESYLEQNVDDFSARFQFKAYDDIISAFSSGQSEIGLFVREPALSYDKARLIDTLQKYEEMVFDPSDKESFFVVEDGLLQPMNASEIRLVAGASARAHSFLGSGDTPAALAAPGGAASAINCDSTYSGMPCNNKIIAFFALIPDGFGTGANIAEKALKRLLGLDYELETHKYRIHADKINSGWADILFDSDAEILYTSFHGTEGGWLLPLECTEVGQTGSRKKELVDKYGVREECIAYGQSKSCPPLGGKEYAALAINPWCIGDMGGEFKWAMQIGPQCYGLRTAVPATAKVLGHPGTTTVSPAVEGDVDLVVDLLVGWAPEPGEYLRWPVDEGIDFAANVKAKEFTWYGGPIYWGEEPPISLDSPCKIGTILVPCMLGAIDFVGVHVYPFVETYGIHFLRYVDYYNLAVFFSDEVTKPVVEMYVFGKNVLTESKENQAEDDWFEYDIDSEVRVVYEGDWKGYSVEEKAAVYKASILVYGAASIANGIEMVGNSLADQTKENPEHRQRFWLYDPDFWMYNARVASPDFSLFQASVPIILNPWVSGASPGGKTLGSDRPPQAAGVRFSYPVKGGEASSKVSVTVGKGCVHLDPDKVFLSEQGKPKFVYPASKGGYKGIEWWLRDDVTIITDLDSRDNSWWQYIQEAWGPEFTKESWPDDYAVKINVSGIESFPNEFPLQGNTASAKKWVFDSDGVCTKDGAIVDKSVPGAECRDYAEFNSDRVPQKEGSFEAWFPCAPQKVACCIPQRDPDYGNAIYYYSCSNEYKGNCKESGGILHEQNVCLAHPRYGYFSEPKENGSIGYCPRPVIPCANENVRFDFKRVLTGGDPPVSDTITESHGGFFTVYGKKSWSFNCSLPYTCRFGMKDGRYGGCDIGDDTCDFLFFYLGSTDGIHDRTAGVSCSGGSAGGPIGIGGQIVNLALTAGNKMCGGDTWYAKDKDGCCKVNEDYDSQRKSCITRFPDKGYTSA